MSKNLFAEPNLKQITVWARGVIQNKDARDVAVGLAEAAVSEGKYVQAWENYVDLPDRINVPVRAYAKISSDPIISKYVYENDAPDIVVLTEETMVKGLDVLEGLKYKGVLVVNTKRSPKEIVSLLDDKGNLGMVVTVDANTISPAVQTLSGAEGATDATGIGLGIAAPLAGAIVKATEIVKMENLADIIANKKALRQGYDECEIYELDEIAPVKAKHKKTAQELLEEMPFAGTATSPVHENPDMITGTWRPKRPVLDKEKCTECDTCWLHCPDACVISSNDGIKFNYKYCKGCGLCEAVCPVDAISMVPELDFK